VVGRKNLNYGERLTGTCPNCEIQNFVSFSNQNLAKTENLVVFKFDLPIAKVPRSSVVMCEVIEIFHAILTKMAEELNKD
jgi:hypothetical protein